MTQQEYEQKKRECWDTLRNELLAGEVQWDPVSRKKIFNYAFDRAYALGKQTETITQEDVEKAAEEYAEKAMEHVYSGEWDSEYVQCLIEAAWYDGYTALGKQEKAITQVEIRKAAVEYANENMWYPGETSYESDINDMTESFADAFESGAKFALGKQGTSIGTINGDVVFNFT